MAKEKKKKIAKTEKKTKNLVSTRGQVFEGYVIRKFPKRVVIELERTVYISKYERFAKKRTRIHARLPEHINIEIGDLIKVQECRPLSKMIHFIVIGITRKADEEEQNEIQ